MILLEQVEAESAAGGRGWTPARPGTLVNAVATHALYHCGQAKPLHSPHKSFESCGSDVLGESHTAPTSGNTATGFLFMVILNMQPSFPNIRVINITAPSDLKSASVLLTFTDRDKMLNYLCFEYEQI